MALTFDDQVQGPYTVGVEGEEPIDRRPSLASAVTSAERIATRNLDATVLVKDRFGRDCYAIYPSLLTATEGTNATH